MKNKQLYAGTKRLIKFPVVELVIVLSHLNCVLNKVNIKVYNNFMNATSHYKIQNKAKTYVFGMPHVTNCQRVLLL